MPDLPQEPDSITAEVVANVAGEVAKRTAEAAGLDPTSAAAIGGFASGTSKSLGPAFARLAHRRQARAALAVDAIARCGDLEKILNLAMEDDQKLELLGRAIESAQRTADLERVRFYGRIAAEGTLASDQAKVDEKARIFLSIAALEPPDLKVLLHMEPVPAWQKRRHYTEHSSTVAREIPEVEPVLDAVFARLENLGLINHSSKSDNRKNATDTFWHVTEFGKLCIRELQNQEAQQHG